MRNGELPASGQYDATSYGAARVVNTDSKLLDSRVVDVRGGQFIARLRAILAGAVVDQSIRTSVE